MFPFKHFSHSTCISDQPWINHITYKDKFHKHCLTGKQAPLCMPFWLCPDSEAITDAAGDPPALTAASTAPGASPASS